MACLLCAPKQSQAVAHSEARWDILGLLDGVMPNQIMRHSAASAPVENLKPPSVAETACLPLKESSRPLLLPRIHYRSYLFHSRIILCLNIQL